MHTRSGGWHELTVPNARAGTRYQFLLEDGTAAPDPASRYQPLDVTGPSEVIDPDSYQWNTKNWTGRPWHDCILYELHIGTFTPQGTFRAVIDKLDYLRDLGITAIELMPVADFPGQRNWGYDGVLWFAPDSSYGSPDDLKALIDAAHARNLMVFLDVVYNHFGPEGNYIPLYAPTIYTGRHHTPWGEAINYDGPESRPVREFAIQNALYWLEEFRLDGLRLDAVHALIDDSPKHILEELAERVHDSIGLTRHVHLVLENGANQSRWLVRNDQNQPRWYSAQWNDDLHHSLHVAATKETAGYYLDYPDYLAKLGRALAEGFSFQGEIVKFLNANRGEPSTFLPPTAFVGFIQNHDQIGNRAFGERLTSIAEPEAIRAIASVYLLCPQIPLLFMGEEYAAAQPFPFFCDFSGALADAVRNGRRAEFSAFPEFSDPASRERIPDPVSPATFQSAKLQWNDLQSPLHSDWLTWYRNLLRVRTEEIVPRLPKFAGNHATFHVQENILQVQWHSIDGSLLKLQACLSDQPSPIPPDLTGRQICRQGSASSNSLGSWSVLWSIIDPT
jgi:malto-oligosyltrehalose trehalohydrolase